MRNIELRLRRVLELPDEQQVEVMAVLDRIVEATAMAAGVPLPGWESIYKVKGKKVIRVDFQRREATG